MKLSLTSFQYQDLEVGYLLEDLLKFYSDRSAVVKSFSVDSSHYEVSAFVVLRDSTGRVNFDSWMFDNDILYKVAAVCPKNQRDTVGYFQVANSFINSFEIVNTDEYWIDKFELSKSVIIHSDVDKNLKRSEADFSYCIRYEEPQLNGFYRGPIIRDDGALLFAHDLVRVHDSLIWKDVLLIDDDLYSYTDFSSGHIYLLPEESIPKGDFNIQFGYLLARDSTKDCYDFHRQILKVSRSVDEFK
jgi:hypothetical protein